MISSYVLALLLVVASDASHAIVRGTVLDPSGAVIVKARVLLINVDTLETFSSVVEDAGKFDEIEVPPGKYEIRTGGAPCFLTDIRKLNLKANQVFDFAPRLKFTDKKAECKTVE